MIRFLGTIFSLLITCNIVLAQRTLTLTGKIQHDESKEIIAHAYLQIGHQLTVLSNHSGEFKIANLPAGSINIEVRHLAYFPKKISIEIQNDTSILISLSKKSIEIEHIAIAENIHNSVKSFHTLDERSRIESQGKSLAEALTDISGVSILHTGSNIAKPVINGHYGNRLLLINKGTRHESQQWGLDHAPEIDPFAHSTISILKDAKTIRYGADAIGGVIILDQDEIDPNRTILGQVNFGANTNGKSGYFNTLLEGTHQAIQYRVGLTQWRGGNMKTAEYILGNTGKSELSANSFIKFNHDNYHFSFSFDHVGTNLGIFQGAHIGTIDDIYSRIENGKPLETYNFTYTIASPRQEIYHNLAKLNYTYQLSQHQFIEAYYSAQQNHRQEFDFRRMQADDVPMMDMKLTTQQFEVAYKSNTSLLGIFGSLQVNNNIAGTGTTPIIPNFDNHNIALFGSHKFNLKTSSLELGARYDYKYFDAAGYRYDYTQKNNDGTQLQYLMTDHRHFNNVSGLFSFNKPFNKKIIFKSNLSLAWRAPSANELYSDGIHHGTGTYEIGNQNLESEISYKWLNNLFYKNKRLKINLDLYGQYIGKYIYSQPNPDSVRQTIRGTFPIFTYQQADAVFYGLDVDAEFQLLANLGYQAQLAVVRARNIESKTYLPFIPADRLQHALAYQFMYGTKFENYIRFKHLYQAQQKRYQANADYQVPPEAYHLFDFIASTSWMVNSNKIAITAACENIFNTAYKDYQDRLRYYSHRTGRNVSLKINYTF